MVTLHLKYIFISYKIRYLFFLSIRVNKNCLKWAQDWFSGHLVGLEAEKDGNKARISKMVECTGDVDLNQRKGKIITIYDVVLKLNWEGKLGMLRN